MAVVALMLMILGLFLYFSTNTPSFLSSSSTTETKHNVSKTNFALDTNATNGSFISSNQSLIDNKTPK